MDPPDNIALGPEELSTIYKVFDAAWAVARHGYDADNPVSTDAARVRLANALLAFYRRGLTDPGELEMAGLRMMGVST